MRKLIKQKDDEMTGKFDIAAAEKALEVLVLAYREERTKPQPDEPIELKNASEVKLAGRKQAYREDIIERPMIGALRLAIRVSAGVDPRIDDGTASGAVVAAGVWSRRMRGILL